VVVDGNGGAPPGARVFTDGADGATVVCTASGKPHPVAAASRRNDVRVWPFAARNGRISLRAVLKRLAAEGMLHVLCEGGGALAGGLLRAGLVDECVLMYAPAFLGDSRAVSGASGADFLLGSMARFTLAETRALGEDVMIRVTRRDGCSQA